MAIFSGSLIKFLLLHPSDPSRISEGMYLHHPGLVVKKSVYEEIGYYNPRFRYSADWEFLVRTLSFNLKWHNSNLIHCTFLYGGQSIVNIRSFFAENKKLRNSIFYLNILVSRLIYIKPYLF